MLVLENLGNLRADAIEKLSLSDNALNVHVERLCNSLFRDASLHRLYNHPVLLNHRQTIDALIVCEGLVVGGNQAGDFGFTHVLEHVDPKMPIEQ